MKALIRNTIVILTVLVATSCGTSRNLSKQDSPSRLADDIWTFSQTHPDGFTLNIRTMTEPTEGICVAYATTQNSHGRDQLESVTSHAYSHDGFVGGWLDTTDSLYYFDSVRLFPEDSLSAAVNFGKANFQKAIYNLSKNEEIILREDVEFVSPTNLIIMYAKEIGKSHLLKAVSKYGAEILYEYNIIPGIAIKIPEGKDINQAIDFFSGIKGVTAVERDHIYHLIEPVKPKLEVR